MRDRWILIGLCALLTLLWLPGLSWPIVSDTSIYALLGESMWTSGRYVLFGEPYAKHLPLQAFVSYPLTLMGGYGTGMKLSSLLAGWGVIVATYLLSRILFDRVVGLVAAALVTMHHGFVLMTMLGSADLLFTVLFLFCLVFFVQAGREDRWYVPAGLCAGLASLARYNGVPLFAFLGLWTMVRRPSHLRSMRFWMGMFAGFGIFALWLLHNTLVFGHPLHTEYTEELSSHAPSLLSQLLSNLVYYVQPQHNILPIALLLSVYGLWRAGSQRWLLLAGMLTAWSITAFWWVQAIRFAFPGFVLLLLLSAVALVDLWRRYPRLRAMGIIILLLPILASHGAALCLYAYPSCNAAFDRSVRWLPPDLGLSPEGFYAWTLARDWIDEHAPPGSFIDVQDRLHAVIWSRGTFRKDLRVTTAAEGFCPTYRITQSLRAGEEVLFATGVHPVTYVLRQECVLQRSL